MNASDKLNTCKLNVAAQIGSLFFKARLSIQSQGAAKERSRLWRFVCDEGGVCQHLFEFEILTKLNPTDGKFLYSTNTESRRAIKRANYGPLQASYFVREMCSVSTMELAWDNYNWNLRGINLIQHVVRPGGPTPLAGAGETFTFDQEHFFQRVVLSRCLRCVKWAREVKLCKWAKHAAQTAAGSGQLDVLKYLIEAGAPLSRKTSLCNSAASFCELQHSSEEIQLQILKYLHSKGFVLDIHTHVSAACYRPLETLKFINENQCELHPVLLTEAAEAGRLDSLQYLIERYPRSLLDWDRARNYTQEQSWDGGACTAAYERNHIEVLKYCIDCKAPLWEKYKSILTEEGRL